MKGVEFGDGFARANGYGSQTNDPFYMDDGRVRTLSNHAGGINGGVSNGNDITLSVALRPTPSISKQQQTVDLTTGEDTMIRIQGRHDPCLGPRAIPCVESAVAIALLDELL